MRTFLALVGGGVGFLIVIPIAVVGVPFWIVALLTRMLKGWIGPQVVQDRELVQFDAMVGWKPKPGIRAVCEAPMVDVFYVETDQEGWRGPASLDESQLVVFGDSYAFGYPVNRPFFHHSTPGLRMKAVAAQGYNMVQELLLMSQLAPRLLGKLVVWFIYPGNDLTDNLSPSMWGYRTPFLLQSGDSWEIFTKHLQPEKWPAHPRFDRNRKITTVFGRNTASDRAYAACEHLIARGQAVCHQAGASLVVLTIPWMIQYEKLPWRGLNDSTLDPDMPDKKIGDMCTKLGVQFLSGRQHFELRHYFLLEGHLNEEGHRHLARILGDLYDEHRTSTLEAREVVRATSPLISV